MADGYLCRVCSKVVGATKNDRYRTHKNAEGVNCEMSSAEIPDDLLQQPPSDTKNAGVPEEGKDFAKCPQCGRNVKLTRLGYFSPHQTTLYGGQQCSTTGVRAFHAGIPKDLPLPGDTIPEKGVNRALRPKVSAQMEVEQSKPKGMPLALPPGASSPSASSKKSAAASSPSPTGTPPDDSPPSEEEALEALKVFEGPGPADPPESTGPPSPESTSTSTTSGPSSGGSEPSGTSSSSSGSLPVFKLGRKLSELIAQPDSPFLQPPEYREPSPVFLQPPEYAGPEKPKPMGDLAKELSVRIKETFYAYDNRKTKDNRSAQTTLGPSEIGTPCDRRLAMALMGVPAVNEGGDGWAAFVGTCGHVGMGEMFTFADAGTGRYAVELPVRTGSDLVPRGTTDLLDRRDGTIVDWKFMGAYSLKKFKLEGPSDTYRVQAHVYGYAATCGGEKVRNVAIVGLPRAGASLDDMHVWTEKYDPKVAEAALDRVERIAEKVAEIRRPDGLGSTPSEMATAQTFPVADDCRYCPFYLKSDKEMRRGCPGV